MNCRNMLAVTLSTVIVAVSGPQGADDFYRQNGYRLPCNSGASPETAALLKYLYYMTSTGILSGQMGEKWDPDNTFDYVYSQCGKYPAVYGIDFLYGDSKRSWIVEEALAQAEAGCIIEACWHAVQPGEAEDDATGWNVMHNGSLPESFIDSLLTPGNWIYDEWLVRLDRIAGYLKQLRDAGIPVIWRPFHEMNGGWFWWGRQLRFVEMWRQMWERFTTYHDLTNLLWMYSPNYYDAGYAVPLDSMYPGHGYVDILALDIYENYAHTYSQSQLDELITIGDHRPVGIGENGKLPPVPTLSGEQPEWVLWMTWNGFQSGHGNTAEWYDTVYNHPYTIDRSEVDIPAIPATGSAVTHRFAQRKILTAPSAFIQLQPASAWVAPAAHARNVYNIRGSRLVREGGAAGLRIIH